ncbi:DUF5954 family protein [Streptomyces fuscigenes]|uniref:DUF5954 family protein n=1 Tax=Streptomyces fuscigenes TaxID=1528880 RepID=UPI001F398373|nr:DUF5954 family protein [Streptomyces fuscigenes]MCF3963699.1 DUF5954 family protein [Streptomyces fuscigenes]
MPGDWMRQIDRLHAGLVRRDDPTAWVREADAVRASLRYPHLALRGPVFGVAAREPGHGGTWRAVRPVTCSTPQEARDALNSLLWFRAKDGDDAPAERRALLAAVGLLERAAPDELDVLGVRYRVVRADEMARSGDEGLEPPRPTDVEPHRTSWEGDGDTSSRDPGTCLQAGQEEPSPMAGALRLALRRFAYTGARFPAEVRADSARAVETHPDVVLLPTGFGVAERRGTVWTPRSSLLPTPHDARRLLYESMTGAWPMLFHFDRRTTEAYARAARRFRAARRANEVRVDDTLFRVCRIERLVRTGPDGPEPPRRSDHDAYGPMRLHPVADDEEDSLPSG